MGLLVRKTIGTERHKALVNFLKQKRELAGLTQVDLAKALGEHQSFIARLESGQRRIDVIEYVTLAEVMGFDAAEALRHLITSFDKE